MVLNKLSSLSSHRFEEEVDGLKVGGQAIAKAIRHEKMRREAEKKKAKRAAEAAATMERA